jgi:hypothetical protein
LATPRSALASKRMPDFEVVLNDVGMQIDDRSKWFRNHHHPWDNLGQRSIERPNYAVNLRTSLTQRYGFGSVRALFASTPEPSRRKQLRAPGAPPRRSSDSDAKWHHRLLETSTRNLPPASLPPQSDGLKITRVEDVATKLSARDSADDCHDRVCHISSSKYLPEHATRRRAASLP